MKCPKCKNTLYNLGYQEYYECSYCRRKYFLMIGMLEEKQLVEIDNKQKYTSLAKTEVLYLYRLFRFLLRLTTKNEVFNFIATKSQSAGYLFSKLYY